MRVVIHGGIFKTGSTSLQQLLHNNRDLLAEEGIIYPFNEIGQHSYVLNARNPDWDAAYLRSIALKAQKKNAKILLLSGEAVSALSQSQFKQLTACFEAWPTEYVFCFRHWASYLPSRWKQNCKRRDSQTFEEYLKHVTNPELAHFDLRYDLILSRAKISGAKAIRSISWDNAMGEDGSAIPEILSALGFNQNLILRLITKSEWLHKTNTTINIDICRILNGLMDYKSKKKANELFWAYANHKECMHFHDIEYLIPRIDPKFKQLIEERLKKKGTSIIEIPNFDNMEEYLFEKHADTFVNIKNKRIFNINSNSETYLAHYALQWQNFIDLIDNPLFNNFEKLNNQVKKQEPC